jgi:hypothetical protein
MTVLARLRETAAAYLRPGSPAGRHRRVRRAVAGADPDTRVRLLMELVGRFDPDVAASVAPADRLAALAETCRRLFPSYRLTWDSLAWFEFQEFNAYLARFGEADGFNAHRRYAVRELLRLTAGIPGDTAECGVYQGAGSYLMAEANRRAGRNETHHGFDSFVGVSRPTGKDGSYWTEGALASPADVARGKLAEFGDAVRLYPGWIPERFGEVADRAFRFVHLDVDLYEPTRGSLEFFYPRVVPGGVVVCDDYLFLTCPGATAAVDEFLADKPEKMIGLPGGGGFFVRGTKTALP